MGVDERPRSWFDDHMAPTDNAPPRFAYTVDEAATALGISRSYLYKLLKTGELKSVRIGASRRITPDAIHDFLAAKAAS